MPGAHSAAGLFAQRIVVGVGDLAVSNDLQSTISTYALGSCVGVIAYDPNMKVGGLLHIMLPTSSLSAEKARTQPAMFADTGMAVMLKNLQGLHTNPTRIRWFLAGGACVLSGPDTFKIGERNTNTVRQLLAAASARIMGENVGGSINRTVHLELSTGTLTLRMPDEIKTYSLA
jgi:chemotaxis protein CheD